MKYMGSKDKLAKDILPIMLSRRRPEQWWVEPFVGGGNIIDKVKRNRLGADINRYTISALISIRDYVNELPRNNKEFTEHQYERLRLSGYYKHKGFAGYAYSYGGKWLGGWCRDGKNKRDYVAEAYRNAVIQSKGLQGVNLVVMPYYELEIPANSIIYCDPPYLKTTNYERGCHHETFWNWCRKMKQQGHRIYISEYEAPDDFKCVFEKKVPSSLTKNTGAKKAIERLFTL